MSFHLLVNILLAFTYLSSAALEFLANRRAEACHHATLAALHVLASV